MLYIYDTHFEVLGSQSIADYKVEDFVLINTVGISDQVDLAGPDPEILGRRWGRGFIIS